jgi:hypothetical protein
MNLSRRTIALAVAVATSFTAFPAGQAQLTTESPFLPAGAGGADTTPQETIELRGIVCRSEGAYFCIYDATKKKSVGWVGLNEPGYGLVVRSYDAANDTIVIETREGTKRLKLSKATIVSVGTRPAVPQPEELASIPAAQPTTELPPNRSPNLTTSATNSALPEEKREYIQAVIERHRILARELADAQRKSYAAASPP